MQKIFPDFIKNLPEANISFKGIKGWLLQGNDRQVVFLEIDPIGEVTKHSHGEQWGIVVEGEMELTIGEVTKTYRKGDYYHIPARTVHSAVFRKKTLAVDVFADKHRYQAK
jgi:quercetin dioxygenase-like cupin family protein